MEAALIIPVQSSVAGKITNHRLLWDPEVKECPIAHLKLLSFVESKERIQSLLSTIRFSCRLANSFTVNVNTWTPELNSRCGYTVSMAPSYTKDLAALFKLLFNDLPRSISKNIAQEFRPKIRVGECNMEEYESEFLSKFGPFSFDVNSISLVTKHNGVFKVRANFPLAPAVSIGSNPSTASSVSSECEDSQASNDLKEISPIGSVQRPFHLLRNVGTRVFTVQQAEQKNVSFSNKSDDIFHPKIEKKIDEKSSSKRKTVKVLKPGKYMLQRKCRVRQSEEMESSFVKDLPRKTVVKVTDIRNNRARIVKPVKGWVSVTTKNGSQTLAEIVPPTVIYHNLPAGGERIGTTILRKKDYRRGPWSNRVEQPQGLTNRRGRCMELETALERAGLQPTKVILVRKWTDNGTDPETGKTISINTKSFAFAEFKTHEEAVKALKTQIKLRDQIYRREKSQKRNLSPFSCVWSLKYKRSQQFKNRSVQKIKPEEKVNPAEEEKVNPAKEEKVNPAEENGEDPDAAVSADEEAKTTENKGTNADDFWLILHKKTFSRKKREIGQLLAKKKRSSKY